MRKLELNVPFTFKSVKGIDWRQNLDIPLAAPSVLPVYVDPEVLSAQFTFAIASVSTNSADPTTNSPMVSSATTSKDAKRIHEPPKTHVAFVEGHLCYRDGAINLYYCAYEMASSYSYLFLILHR